MTRLARVSKTMADSESEPPVLQVNAETPRSFSRVQSDKNRSGTRVNIGVAFPRWRALEEAKGLTLDTEVAHFLLDVSVVFLLFVDV